MGEAIERNGLGMSLLIVDDERDLAEALGEGLEYVGYSVEVVFSGEEALKRLAERRFEALISDIHMPKIRGDELQRRARALDSDLVVLMITAAGDVTTAVQCMKEGAYDYIIKPFDLHDMTVRLEKALERRRMQLELRDYQANLERRVAEQSESMRRMLLNSLQALNSALEAKDEYTHEHSERVSRIVVALAERIYPEDAELHHRLLLAARFHDIGKIGVPEAILHKPTKLTPTEFEEIKKHPVIGEAILRPLFTDAEILAIVRHHHEQWCGAGYPDGLKGEAIPLGARFVAAADAYDAMTSARPYRAGMPAARALEILREGAGRQWDATLVNALLELAKTGALEELMNRSQSRPGLQSHLRRVA